MPPGENAVDDLSDVIDEFSTGRYIVTRSSSTVYANGFRQPPSSTTFEIDAVVWPASGRDLQRLPEGLRTRETKNLVTQVELKTAASGAEPDSVLIEGAAWRVETANRWAPNGNFFHAMVTREGA